jgi:hypothetical protein
VAFKCPCGSEDCLSVWQGVEDMHALGYFPCSKDPDRVEMFAHAAVFRDWRNRLVCNPGGSFNGYVKELDSRSREHACVRPSYVSCELDSMGS